jgi:hypothetical protein
MLTVGFGLKQPSILPRRTMVLLAPHFEALGVIINKKI